MRLTTLKAKSRKKTKRIGRGNASGHGTFSTKGMKGQTARSGGRRRPGFEGGQTPLLRKMPKYKGFTNPNHIEYQIINLDTLNVFDDKAVVTIETLLQKKIIAKSSRPVKLLGKGKLEKALEITVHKASASAAKAVEAAKGKLTLLEEKKTTKSEE